MTYDSVPLYHDDNTLRLVSAGIVKAGVGDDKVVDVVNCIMNNGIVFREIPNDNVDWPTVEVNNGAITRKIPPENAPAWHGRSVTTTNLIGEWVPGIPEAFSGTVWKYCISCDNVFWTCRGYQGHYALCHILRLRYPSKRRTVINWMICVVAMFTCLAIAAWLEFV